jgi:hypothetical protein
MQFLSVSAINAQFSVNVGGTAGAGGIGQGASGQASGSIGYSDAPTITYVPQSDAAAYKSLYGSFEVSEVIGFSLSYRFARMNPAWQALSLRFSFASINGADDFVGGNLSSQYDQRVRAFIRLLQLGASIRQIPEWDFDTSNILKESVAAEDMVAAFRMGLNFVEENDGQYVRLARYRLVPALTLPDPDDPEVIAALNDLGVAVGRTQYVLRPPAHSTPGEVDPYAIWVTPRSMNDAINLAAQCVEVPAEHAHIVPSLGPEAGESSISTLRIRSAREEPVFPYRVQHRGYWFYVDDTDLGSKVFLEAMVAAYSSRVGSKRAEDAPPQVVLPVGGS